MVSFCREVDKDYILKALDFKAERYRCRKSHYRPYPGGWHNSLCLKCHFGHSSNDT